MTKAQAQPPAGPTPRTAAELDRLIAGGDQAGCIEFFAGMHEDQRRSFAKTAEAAFKAARKTPWIRPTEGHIQRNPALVAATAAAFASCSLSTLKQLGWAAVPHDAELIAILSDRRPDWSDAYAEYLLDQEHPRWAAVRTLMKAGVCRKPKHDNYVIGMLNHFVGVGTFRHRHTAIVDGTPKLRGVLEHLLEEPDLLDDVWRLFELEGGGEYSLAGHDKFSAAGNASWRDSLVELSRRGVLSRERLLDASLEALERGFAQFRAGWFSAFHEALEPTVAERKRRASSYLRLVASPIAPTVSFALKAVELIDRHAPLEPSVLIESLKPALLSRAKATAKGALQLLDRVAGRDPAAVAAACRAAVDGLRHEAPDVQGAVLALLEKFGSPHDGELREELARHVDSIAASLRRRLQKWLAEDGPQTETTATAAPLSKTSRAKAERTEKRPPARSGGSDTIAELRARAARIPRALRMRAGVDRALAALQSGTLDLTACPFDGTDVPRLDPARKMTPLGTLDELIDTAAALLEARDDYDALERVLDGVSRLCDQRPEDFDRRTGPLFKRCRQILPRLESLPFYGNDPYAHLVGLLVAWLSRDPGTFQTKKERDHTKIEYRIAGNAYEGYVMGTDRPDDPVRLRCQRIAQRAARGEAAALLSAPTHAGGWIDPVVLAERVRTLKGAQADDLDIALALLRLAPERRDRALKKLEQVRGDAALACRYALGDARTARKPGPAWLWAAASRARSAWQPDEKLAAALPEGGPDVAEPARVEATIGDVKKYSPLKLRVLPAVPGQSDFRFWTLYLWRRTVPNPRDPFEHETVAAIRAAQMIWPAAMEAVCAQGARMLAANLDWWEADWALRAHLGPLLDPDLPLRDMARLLLVLGLAAKEPGERGLATDACIAAIADGRLDGDLLGNTMGRLWPPGLIRLKRWADSLGQVARTSPLHTEVLRSAVDVALCECPKQPPKDLSALLGLLLELVHETGSGVSDKARAALSRLSGSSKTSQLAREILAQTGTPAADRIAAIMHSAVDSRLARAERWLGSGQ